jgi:DNA mismatch repair protein MutS2
MVKGVPGASSALAVAKRLGMDAGIIGQAKAILDGGDVRIETALEELAQEKSVAQKERREAEKLKKEAKSLTDNSRQLNVELKLLREDISKTAKKKLRADIADARQQLAAIIEEARAATGDMEKLAISAEAVEKIEHEARLAAAPEETIDRANLAAGDEVYIVPLEKNGKLESDPIGGEAKVICGSLRVTVKLVDIIGTAHAPKKGGSITSPTSPSLYSDGVGQENVEIDLRGLRAEEATDKAEKFIDEMINRQADSVRIIHGKGTGALRAAIREYLENSRYNASYRSGSENEGGDGVTIVTF